jgi:hypothetical protein
MLGRWLGQGVISPFGQHLDNVLLAIVAGQYIDRQIREALIGFDSFLQGDAVHARHLFVEQQQIDPVGGAFQCCPGRQAIGGAIDGIAGAFENLFRQREEKFVIIDDQ